MTKQVSFSTKIDICHIPPYNLEWRSIFYTFYFRNTKLLHNLSYELANLLNFFTKHQIILDPNGDIPIKITNYNKPWYDDDSIVILNNVFRENKGLIFSFIDEFNKVINKKIKDNKNIYRILYKSKLTGLYIDISQIKKK